MFTSTPNAKRRKTNNGKENGNENGASADANNNRTKPTPTALVPPSVTTKQSKADVNGANNTHTRKRKIENIQSSTSRVPCCADCDGICLLCIDQKAKERKAAKKAAQVAKKAAQVAAKAAKKVGKAKKKVTKSSSRSSSTTSSTSTSSSSSTNTLYVQNQKVF